MGIDASESPSRQRAALTSQCHLSGWTLPSPAGREYLCLDGNTRVAIYRELADQNVPGDWTTINTEIIEPEDEEDRVRSVEQIRMISHIVGAREWSPYRQAKYLYELRNKLFFSWDHIVGLSKEGRVRRTGRGMYEKT